MSNVPHLHSNLTLKENMVLIVSDPTTQPRGPPLNYSSIVHTQDKAQGEISQTQNTSKHPQPAANALLRIGL